MKLQLRAIKDGKDKNRFCGPSVISAVTKLTTGEAARLIRKNTGRRRITGTSTSEIVNALLDCNITVRPYRPYDKDGERVRLGRRFGPTLARWLKLSKKDRTSDRVFLVVAGWHWQLVSGRRYTCGRIREIVSVRDKRVKRRARVSEVYELFSENVTRPEIDLTKPKDPNASVRAKAHKLAKKIGVTLEVERSYGTTDIWVNPPEGVTDEEDPYGISGHTAFDWDEALEMLTEYELFLQEREKAAA